MYFSEYFSEYSSGHVNMQFIFLAPDLIKAQSQSWEFHQLHLPSTYPSSINHDSDKGSRRIDGQGPIFF